MLELLAAAAIHLQIHGLSVHSKSHYDVATLSGEFMRKEPYNWLNLGAGLRIQSGDVALQVGRYRNSFYSKEPNRHDPMISSYAVVDWTPLEVGGAKAGVSAGVVNGYKLGGGWQPAGSLLARWGDQYSVTTRIGWRPKTAGFIGVEFGIKLR